MPCPQGETDDTQVAFSTPSCCAQLHWDLCPILTHHFIHTPRHFLRDIENTYSYNQVSFILRRHADQPTARLPGLRQHHAPSLVTGGIVALAACRSGRRMAGRVAVVPDRWLNPGEKIGFQNFPTGYGLVSGLLEVGADGRQVAVTVNGIMTGTQVQIRIANTRTDTVAGQGTLQAVLNL